MDPGYIWLHSYSQSTGLNWGKEKMWVEFYKCSLQTTLLWNDRSVTTTEWGDQSFCCKSVFTGFYQRKAMAALIDILPDLKDHRSPKRQVTVQIWNSLSLEGQMTKMNGFLPHCHSALWHFGKSASQKRHVILTVTHHSLVIKQLFSQHTRTTCNAAMLSILRTI